MEIQGILQGVVTHGALVLIACYWLAFCYVCYKIANYKEEGPVQIKLVVLVIIMALVIWRTLELLK